MLSQWAAYFAGLLLHCLVLSSLSYPIYHFIIHETRSGTLLEFSRLDNITIYNNLMNSTTVAPVTVVLLTNNPKQKFDDLEKLLPAEVNFVHDQRDFYKLKTPQVHVLVRSAHSTALPGIVKFMTPLKKIAKFITMSLAIEKDIVSPNIDKALCYPDQQVLLMNTILGNYRAFTMYVVNWAKTANSTELINDLEGKQESDVGGLKLSPAIARDILNPIRCDLMFGQDIIDIDT